MPKSVGQPKRETASLAGTAISLTRTLIGCRNLLPNNVRSPPYFISVKTLKIRLFWFETGWIC